MSEDIKGSDDPTNIQTNPSKGAPEGLYGAINALTRVYEKIEVQNRKGVTALDEAKFKESRVGIPRSTAAEPTAEATVDNPNK